MTAANAGGAGTAPLPRTGRAFPIADDAADARVAGAIAAFRTIWIPNDRQRATTSRINVLRLSSLGARDVPLDGRRLSQVSQAGKSRMLTQYTDRMNSEAIDGVVNPNRVLYFELKGAQSLKMFSVMVLQRLLDPHWNEGNADDVQERVRRFLRARSVELLIIDEVQHLKGDAQSKMAITDELKLFLDSGIVPVVFAGNEKSKAFFEQNEQLCGRLGEPLELSPIDQRVGDDQRVFKKFCHDLDAEMLRAGVTRIPSNLVASPTLKGLYKSSGGHLGRVVRIVQAAAEHAAARDADSVERYDLSRAVGTFAIPLGYVASDPFAA